MRRSFGSHFSSVEVDSVEYAVEVHYESSPPEPDVGFPGGLDVTSVMHRTSNLDLTDRISREKLELLAREIEGEL